MDPVSTGSRRLVGAMDIKTLQASDTSEVVPPLSFGAGFRFKGSKAWNGIEIFLNLGDDSYSLRFYRMKLEAKAGTVLTLGEWMHGVYA